MIGLWIIISFWVALMAGFGWNLWCEIRDAR